VWRALTHTLPLRGAFPSERLRAATRRMPGESSVSAGTAAAPRGGGYNSPMAEATTITPKPNGPLVVQGPVKIVAPDGRELPVPPRKDGRPAEVVVLCRCGGSATKPFC